MLLEAIEKKRAQMIETAQVHGLHSKKVLQYSQELDKLIDLYQSQLQIQDKSPKRKFVLFKRKFCLKKRATTKANQPLELK
ncbi:MAG TPA: aspartyl-phosphate phosphatase Spo0E family protein [Bacillales bacterium]|nr:aspartyl-phosphate phosphatase Spo0E family protein [Bacillales bacterium]